MEAKVRDLNEVEVKILDKVELSEQTKLAVKKQWESSPADKVDLKSVDVKQVKAQSYGITFALVPLTLVALGANLFYNLPLLSQICNLGCGLLASGSVSRIVHTFSVRF